MPLYIDYPSWLHPEIFPGLPIRWYGLMYAVALLVTYFLFRYQVKKEKLDITSDDTLTMMIWVMLTALLSARIFYALVYDPKHEILRHPWTIIWPFHDGRYVGIQGMSFFGGLLGAVLGAFLWSWKYKTDLLLWSDLIVQGFPLGYTFGRLGNFINGELYGRITASPLGMIFPLARRVETGSPESQHIINKLGLSVPPDLVLINLPRYPSQLFEAFFEGIVLWLIMWFIVRPRRPYKGFSVAIFVIGYSFFRFIVEFFRELDDGFHLYTPLNLSLGQLFCILGMIGGGVALYFFHRAHKNRPQVETFH